MGIPTTAIKIRDSNQSSGVGGRLPSTSGRPTNTASAAIIPTATLSRRTPSDLTGNMSRSGFLIPTWYVGDRGAESAWEFMQDLAPRLANRVQLTTDGYRVYLEAVDEAFRGSVDYAMLVKIPTAEMRVSPRHATARQSATGQRKPFRAVTRTRSTSRPAMPSGRISRCACR